MNKRLAALAAALFLASSFPAASLAAEKPKSEAQLLAEEGYGYLTTGRYVEAIYALQKAVELAPDRAFLYYDLGIAYYSLGQFERAVEYYDKAIQIRPKYANALVNRAKALEKLGRRDEALMSYDKALDVEPNADDIHIHRGYFYAQAEDHPKAIEEYKMGVRLNPKSGQGHYWLAKSYAKTGKPAEAWEHVHEAQKAGYPVDKDFLRDLEFQLPEPLGSKPEVLPPDPSAGPIVTPEDLAESERRRKAGDPDPGFEGIAEGGR